MPPAAARDIDDATPAAVRLPLYRVTLDDDPGEGAVETWIQVLRTGKFWSPRYKNFAVTTATLARMVENFKTVTPKTPTELPLDYNHGTNRPETIEQGKAAGWIQDLEVREDGTELWAHVRLTAEAADLVRNEEYRFVSATFEFDHVHTDGEHRKKSIGPTLASAALTNTPFVEGMAPVKLAKESAVALDDDAAMEPPWASFSHDEQRRRVQEALSVTYGDSGCYLVDLFDGRAVYRETDGLFFVSYTIDAAGAVAFTDDPTECVADYRPLAQPAGAEMATIKVKDAKGTEFELSEETVKALAKEHAPKPAASAADETALDEIRTSLANSQTENLEMAKRVATLETEKKEMAAKTLVDALIRAGKVPLKKREQYVTLAINDRKTFTELTTDLPVIYQFGKETGSGDDGGDQSATQEVLALAREAMTSNTKLTQSDAIAQVLGKHPGLYERYKTESAVRV
jgi:phage I-like protein